MWLPMREDKRREGSALPISLAWKREGEREGGREG